jgi:hypothetical protein
MEGMGLDEALAADGFEAEAIEAQGDELFWSATKGSDAGLDVVFEPTAKAEGFEVVMLIEGAAELAKESQDLFRVLAMAKAETKFQERIDIFAPSGAKGG